MPLVSNGVAGLILAGGEGRRWGGPKAFAKLPDGSTFLEACARTLLLAKLQPVAATVPLECDGPEIAGLEIVRLPTHGLDMFASLRCGLQRLSADSSWASVIVLPVDHPLISEQTVHLLAECSGVTVPSYRGKHGHPVRLTREVAETVVSGRLTGPTLRDVLKAGPFSDLQVDDPGVVTNCNTPEALASALRRRAGRGG